MRNISLYVWFFSSGWISRSGIAMSKIMNLFQSLHMYCQIALQKVCVYQVTFPQAAYEIVYRFLISDFIVFAYLIGEKRTFVVVLCLLFWEFLIWLEFGFIHCFTPSLCDIFEFVHFLRYVDHSDEEYNIVLSSCTYKTWIYFVVNLNGAYPKLVPFRPAGRLISPPLLLSVILNILLSLAMHIVGFILVQRQPWYSVGMHRYGHNFRISPSNFYQASSSLYDNRQMGLQSTKGFGFLKPLAIFQWSSLLGSTVWWYHSLALIFAHLVWYELWPS